MKKQKRTTPLFSAVTLSMACVSLLALAGSHGVYHKYDTDGWSQPAVSVLMQALAHHDYPWNNGGTGSLISSADSAVPSANQPDYNGVSVSVLNPSEASGNTASNGTDAGGNGDSNPGNPAGMNGSSDTGASTGVGGGSKPGSSVGVGGASNSGNSTDIGGASNPGNSVGGDGASSPGNSTGIGGTSNPEASPEGDGSSNPGVSAGGDGASNPGSTTGLDGSSGNMHDTSNNTSGNTSADGNASPEEPVQYEFTNVTQEYFDDALFIGDSRATGVKLYSGWDNLTYYAENGMTIYNMFESKSATDGDQATTIEEALQKRSFGKIYLEIGINEMGTGNVDSFMKAYEEAVAHLRELQPDAIIYVCGIMYVKQSKSESDPIFNNPNIQERNDRIAQLADGQNIFYLDINELVTDDTGNLNPDYTWDEVHLLGKYDSLWLDYFCSHGIIRDGK